MAHQSSSCGDLLPRSVLCGLPGDEGERGAAKGQVDDAADQRCHPGPRLVAVARGAKDQFAQAPHRICRKAKRKQPQHRGSTGFLSNLRQSAPRVGLMATMAPRDLDGEPAKNDIHETSRRQPKPGDGGHAGRRQ
jgi:hypothetical protein